MLYLIHLLAEGFGNTIAFLNDRTFEKSIVHRRQNEVWVVCFTGSTTDKSEPVQMFTNASKLSDGMISFAIIDVSRFPAPGTANNVERVPDICMFHSGGVLHYAPSSAKDLLKKALTLLPDHLQVADLSWRDDLRANPSAIFFTDKEKVPVVWRAISSHYYGQRLRIGWTNDTDLSFPFGVKNLPAIFMSNGTVTRFYKGKVKFGALTNAIDSFFQKGASETEATTYDGFAPMKEFRGLCVGQKRPCVIVKAEGAESHLEKLKKDYAKLKMNWLVGTTNLPYEFMKAKEGVWIYHPRKDAFAYAKDTDELELLLEKMENGAIRWTDKQKLMSEEL